MILNSNVVFCYSLTQNDFKTIFWPVSLTKYQKKVQKITSLNLLLYEQRQNAKPVFKIMCYLI